MSFVIRLGESIRMNGVESVTSLDLIAKSEEHVNLVIVQTNNFSSDLFESFEKKINSYLTYVNSGQLLEDYPNTSGLGVRISIDMHVQINDDALSLFKHTAEVLLKHNVSFVWNDVS